MLTELNIVDSELKCFLSNDDSHSQPMNCMLLLLFAQFPEILFVYSFYCLQFCILHRTWDALLVTSGINALYVCERKKP